MNSTYNHFMQYSLLFLVLGLFTACTQGKKEASWDEENIRSLEVADARVKQAMKSAQDNIENFIRHYKQNSRMNDMNYFIKCGFTNSETTEHMWINVVAIDSLITGVLDNVPQMVSHVEYLDTVLFRPKQVEDFVIYHGDTLIHGDYLSNLLKP